MNMYSAMAGNYAQCNCESERLLGFGALSGERMARNFYGDAAYEFMVADAKRRSEQERTRRDLIRRGDFIDDVAGQLQPEN